MLLEEISIVQKFDFFPGIDLPTMAKWIHTSKYASACSVKHIQDIILNKHEQYLVSIYLKFFVNKGFHEIECFISGMINWIIQ